MEDEKEIIFITGQLKNQIKHSKILGYKFWIFLNRNYLDFKSVKKILSNSSRIEGNQF